MATRIGCVLLICTTSVIIRLITAQSPDRSNIDIQFLIEPSDVIVSKGRQAVFHCNVIENLREPSNIIWFHNDTKITSNKNIIIHHNGTLNIEKVKRRREKSDTGTYRCLVEISSAALLSRRAYLKIAHISAFSLHPENIEVFEGETIRLSCYVDSLPEAEIKWTFQNISISDQITSKYDTSIPGVLYIQNVQISDQGAYRCIASNRMLSKRKVKISNFGLLKIKTKSHMSSNFNVTQTQLLTSSSPSSKTIRDGEPLILECAVSGLSNVEFTWNFRTADNSSSKLILKESNKRKSILKKITTSSSDSGTYTCCVFPEKSLQNLSKSTVVNVITPPVISERPKSVTSPLGRIVRFTCRVQGYPLPVTNWIHNGITLKSDARIKVEESELVLTSTNQADAGIYQCIASNEHSSTSAATQLYINDSMKPSSPVDIHCRPIDTSSIYVSWRLPDDDTSFMQPPIIIKDDVIQQKSALMNVYTVNYYPIDGKDEFIIPSPTESIELKHLNSATTYIIYVRAYNGRSGSDPSQKITCTTESESDFEQHELPIIKSSWETLPIQGDVIIPKEKNEPVLNVEQLNDTSIKVSWNMEKPTISDDKYRIVYKKSVDNSTRSVNIEFDQKFVVLHNLELRNKYDISMKIIVNGTEGNMVTRSIKLGHMTELENLLNPPRNIEVETSSSTTITVSWKPSTDPRVSSYTVLYSQPIDIFRENRDNYTSFITNSTETTINDLEPRTAYSIQLITNDAYGRHSEPSRPVFVTTPVPEPVNLTITNIQYEQLNSSSIRLKWIDPTFSSEKSKPIFVSYSSSKDRHRLLLSAVNIKNEYFVDFFELMSGENYSAFIYDRTEGRPNSVIGKTSFKINSNSHSNALTSQNEFFDVAGIRLNGEQFIGVLIGIGIGSIFIVICLCTLYICKKRLEKRYQDAAVPAPRDLDKKHEMRIISKTLCGDQCRHGNGCGSCPKSQLPLLSTKTGMSNGHVENLHNSDVKYYDGKTSSGVNEVDNLLNSYSVMDETCLSVLDKTNDRDHEGGDSGYCDRNHVQSPLSKDCDTVRRLRKCSDMTVDDGFYENELPNMYQTT